MRRLLAVLLVCLLCGLCSGYAYVGDWESVQTTGEMPISVNGVPAYTGYLVDGEVYVPLRSFCAGLRVGAVVQWDAAAETMTVTTAHQSRDYILTARVGDVYLYVNDRIVYLEQPIGQVRGNVIVPLLPVARAFGVTVEETAEGMQLDTATLQICQRGSAVYDPTDLKWLSHIINAEAGNQSLEGQICVGNVVLNRVADARFPDTVQGVIFSPNQFCPVKSGTIYCTPDADAVAAAKLCLEGVNLAGESTYFVNPTTGSTAWFRANLTYAMRVGDHDFYF